MSDEPAKLRNPGVVAVLIGPDGRVVVSVNDFHLSAPGGCSTWEGQKWRCRTRLANALIAESCNGDVAKAIENYDAEKIMNRMIDQQGYRLHYIDIGHGVDLNG